MAWPTGTRVDELSISDPPTYVLGAVWDCISSTSSSSKLKIIFPWGETRTVTVRERITATWYNPNNPNEWLSFWAIGCSSSGTYGIANYGYVPPEEPPIDEEPEPPTDKKDNKLIMIILIILAAFLMRV